MKHITERIFLDACDSSGREKLISYLDDKHPSLSYTAIGRSILSRPIYAFYIGSGKGRICIFAAHHALEDITSNIAFLLCDYLLSMPCFGTVKGVDCKLLLSKYTFIIVPCVNPDGIEMRYHGAEKGPLYDRQIRMSGNDFSLWQANARGVDLNHNYDFRFAEYKIFEKEMGISPGATLYSGETAESEPETRYVANLVRTVAPVAVVSLHAQGEEIYAFPNNVKMRRRAKRLADMCGYSTVAPSGTASYGGLCDYTGSLGIPSFTVEVGRGKNPLSLSLIPSIFERIGPSLAILPTIL